MSNFVLNDITNIRNPVTLPPAPRFGYTQSWDGPKWNFHKNDNEIYREPIIPDAPRLGHIQVWDGTQWSFKRIKKN